MGGFNNAVVGGASLLIRAAIESAGYVAGSSGWILRKDGSAELNNAVIRGEVDAGNNTVRLNSGGIHVEGSGVQYDINIVGGFLTRLDPATNAYGQLNISSAPFGGLLNLMPDWPTADPSATYGPAQIFPFTSAVGTDVSPKLTVKSPQSIVASVTNLAARVILYGQSSQSLIDNTIIELVANTTIIDGQVQLGSIGAESVTLPSTNFTNGTTTSTSFTNTLTTTGIHGIAFVAPPSGEVNVIGRATAANSIAGSYAVLDFEVRQGPAVGSGTVVRASDNFEACFVQAATAGNQGPAVTTALVSGLTPGSVYNAALTYQIATSGTASYNRRHIIVTPVVA